MTVHTIHFRDTVTLRRRVKSIHVTVVQLGLTVAVHVKALSLQSAQTK